jgi:hypothetical protein
VSAAREDGSSHTPGAAPAADLLVTRVEPFAPGSECASVTVASELGVVVVFCHARDVRAGSRVANRLRVLDAHVLQAADFKDRPADERPQSAIDRLERTGEFAYAGCGRVLDAEQGHVLALGFVLDFGDVPAGADHIEFEVTRLDIR